MESKSALVLSLKPQGGPQGGDPKGGTQGGAVRAPQEGALRAPPQETLTARRFVRMGLSLCGFSLLQLYKN